MERTNVCQALTTREVAEALGVSRRTVTRWVNDGSLRAVRLGRVVRIPTAELERLLRL